MLKSRGWPFTVFVNTDPHDRRLPLYMSWDELRELGEHGGTIANHTVSHDSLVRLPHDASREAWAERLRWQVEEAQRRIETELGGAEKMLAYPYGEFDADVMAEVAALGYVAFGQNSGPLAVHDDLQALPRFPFGSRFGQAQDFRDKTLSLPMPSFESRISGPKRQPLLEMSFTADGPVPNLSCFATGQGAITLEREDRTVRVQSPQPIQARRFRYNCTAPSGQPGRFFWVSRHWTVPIQRSENTP